MMNVAGDATIKDEGQSVFYSDPFIHRAPPPELACANRDFAGKMVGLGFAGGVLAVYGGLFLAFWLRFDTPVQALGRRATLPMTTGQYHGRFYLLTEFQILLMTFFRRNNAY